MIGRHSIGQLPRVSVIVATYNSGPTIEAMLQSCAAQRQVNLEILVIDGASTDDTMTRVRRFAEVKVVSLSEPDRGVYDAWNKALCRMNGEFYAFLGSDDTWAYPFAVRDLVGVAESRRAEFVVGRGELVNERGEVLRAFGRPWRWQSIKRRHSICHPGALHRRSLFERVGMYDPRYRIAGDYDYSLRMGRETRAAFLNRVIIRMGSSGLSNRNARVALWEVYRAQREHPDIRRPAAVINLCVSAAVVYGKRIIGRG